MASEAVLHFMSHNIPSLSLVSVLWLWALKNWIGLSCTKGTIRESLTLVAVLSNRRARLILIGLVPFCTTHHTSGSIQGDTSLTEVKPEKAATLKKTIKKKKKTAHTHALHENFFFCENRNIKTELRVEHRFHIHLSFHLMHDPET